MCGSKRRSEKDEASPSGAQTTWPPLHCGDLEEGRTHKIIISKTQNIREKWGIRIDDMVKLSAGCDRFLLETVFWGPEGYQHGHICHLSSSSVRIWVQFPSMCCQWPVYCDNLKVWRGCFSLSAVPLQACRGRCCASEHSSGFSRTRHWRCCDWLKPALPWLPVYNHVDCNLRWLKWLTWLFYCCPRILHAWPRLFYSSSPWLTHKTLSVRPCY